MTALPAEKLGLKDRGLIAEGYMADLVAFNPATIHERSTYVDPHQKPLGIEYVLVNGAMALEKGRLCGLGRGRILKR